MKSSHKREIMLLLILLIVFQAIFAIAMINLKRGIPTFNLGLSYQLEDYIIAIFSLLSIIRIIWILIKH